MRIPLILCAFLAFFIQFTPQPLLGSEVKTIQENSEWKNFAFNIEDSKTRVGIASIKLIVSTLKPEDGNLVGEYSIEVPLLSSKNDKGRIVLPLKDNTVNDLSVKGGILRGQAISDKEGKKPSSIVCEIIPQKNKTILLEITTKERTLKFKSNYTISKVEKAI